MRAEKKTICGDCGSVVSRKPIGKEEPRVTYVSTCRMCQDESPLAHVRRREEFGLPFISGDKLREWEAAMIHDFARQLINLPAQPLSEPEPRRIPLRGLTISNGRGTAY